MKFKQLLIICCCTILLSACQSTDNSLKEIEKPSDDVLEVINADATLQVISNGDTYYVAYRTNEDVKVSSTIKDDTYRIQLDTTATTDGATVKEYLYTFDSSDKFDSVVAIINGKEMAFDTVIVTD